MRFVLKMNKRRKYFYVYYTHTEKNSKIAWENYIKNCLLWSIKKIYCCTIRQKIPLYSEQIRAI